MWSCLVIGSRVEGLEVSVLRLCRISRKTRRSDGPELLVYHTLMEKCNF